MAGTIYCDNAELHADAPEPVPAEWLVSRLGDGESLAWCDPCYLQLCQVIAAQAAPEAPAPAPEPAGEPDEDDEDAADAEAIRRLDKISAAQGPANGAERSAPAPADSGAPGPAEGAQEPAQVVKRGTSRSRRAHEARKRSKAKAAEPEPAQE